MTTRYYRWPCVCLAQIGVLSKWLDGSSLFELSYTVLQGNSGIYKTKSTSLWNTVLNSRRWKFRHGMQIVETRCRLRQMWTLTARAINGTFVGKLCWQYVRRSTDSLSHWSPTSTIAGTCVLCSDVSARVTTEWVGRLPTYCRCRRCRCSSSWCMDASRADSECAHCCRGAVKRVDVTPFCCWSRQRIAIDRRRASLVCCLGVYR